MTESGSYPISPLGIGRPDGTGTVLILLAGGDPARIGWLGPAADGLDPAAVSSALGSVLAATSVHDRSGRSLAVLPEVSRFWHGQPGLRGHRMAAGRPGADWSTAFAAGPHTAFPSDADPQRVELVATDTDRGLTVRSEFESVPGGAIRIRHTVTNDRPGDYLLHGLDVMVPVPDRVAEILDLTGRWGRERVPQRHPVRDGLWLREGRTGRPGPESATLLTVGTTGFGFGTGQVWGVHLAWSGNSRHFVERLPTGQTVLGAGELLLPGEVVLAEGDSYATPWAYFVAGPDGLDGLADQLHGYLRALPAHPKLPRPVVCNVWEAVYFDHDLDRLRLLADQVAAIGIERFVLDDGWFSSRRDDRSGLGDWTVSTEAWPDGLGPLVEHVRGLGMQFGLWFEPEMVNADSELFRAHPDWVLAVPDRPLLESRNQLVLDLGRAEVGDYLFAQLDRVLSEYPIDYVKWDHNRPLGDGASPARGGAAGVHRQTLGFYALLDRLRQAHPGVEWESCASGGARIDLAVLERCQRVWTSDMTDALARQQIQRWTSQLVPPEYLGAHVSAPVNHQTGRTLSLDFRAGTAFFGDFGLEWDITQASPAERARLAGWIELYKQHRRLLHGGRLVRQDAATAPYWIHGVLAPDRSAAIMAYVQLDEAVAEPVPFLVTGLDPHRRYRASRLLPPADEQHPAAEPWAGQGLQLTGAVLAAVGLPTPQRQPESCLIVRLDAL